MKQIHITMPPQTIAALKEKSKETGLGVAEIIRRAVDAYLERVK
jgi:predicted DNA-binding protein